jgi:hypothetical protein
MIWLIYGMNWRSWSREDRHEELGRFVARIRGGWVHVGLPHSQTVLPENERKQLSNIFDNAGLDLTDPPSPEIVPKILSYYGQSVLENRIKTLLESPQIDDDVLKKVLVELVLDELEEWDGTIPELTTKAEYSSRQQVHTSLRLCIKLDPMASHLETHVRFKTSRPFPEEGLYFKLRDGHLLDCFESQRGWSTPIKGYSRGPSEKLNGALLEWAAGVLPAPAR